MGPPDGYVGAVGTVGAVPVDVHSHNAYQAAMVSKSLSLRNAAGANTALPVKMSTMSVAVNDGIAGGSLAQMVDIFSCCPPANAMRDANADDSPSVSTASAVAASPDRNSTAGVVGRGAEVPPPQMAVTPKRPARGGAPTLPMRNAIGCD